MHLKKKLNLPLNGLVLEVGGGGLPHVRSNVLVDRFLDDKEGFAQRGRVPLVIGNRVMIQADGALMPFGDKKFDYVILSHVIEHIPVENIHQFVAELQRVASSGYIEAPSILYEAMRDVPEHVWYVVCDSGVIHICKKKSVSQWHPFINPLFDDADFCTVIERYADLFFTGMEWHGDLKIEVHEDVSELIALYPTDWAKTIVTEGLEHLKQIKRSAQRKNRIKSLLPPIAIEIGQKIVRPIRRHLVKTGLEKPMTNWQDIVICPICHSSLQVNLLEQSISCTQCQQEYIIRNDGIPSFIVENEISEILKTA